jgi:hypothetical protein
MTNFQTKNSIQTLKNWKPTLTYILNIVGALLLASLLTLGLTYVGLLGELSSQGIFIL